jgi:FAD/FMN-containing dehydrogenase/Fe-S oxidoreductase
MLKTNLSRGIQKDLFHDLERAQLEFAADHVTRLLYSTDASIYQIMPIAVIWPRDADQVCQVIDIASEYQVPILPRGSGSSLAGQAIGTALILDFSRYMTRIQEINQQEKYVKVQPGLVLGSLNRQIKSAGLKFGPDPASADRATIGGVLGNNATGAHSILYGMAHNHLLDLEVVLSDGNVINLKSVSPQEGAILAKKKTLEGKIFRELPELLDQYHQVIRTKYPNTFRNVAGYNLKALSDNKPFNPALLMAGAEGTLGVITSARLNLVPLPKFTGLYLVHFDELGTALEAVPPILETKPSAVELIDSMLINLARANPAYQNLLDPVQGNPEAVLAVEYQSDQEAEILGKEQQLNDFGITSVILESNLQDNIWKARKVGLGILQSQRGDHKPTTFIEDAAVPVEHLAAYALEIKKYAGEIGVEGIAFYAHASAGLLHIRPAVNLKSRKGIQQMRDLAEKSLELVLKYGGTTSGEHGEGISRGEFSEKLFGRELTEAFHKTKGIFDPAGLFNPGRITNPPAMDEDNLLRYGQKYQADYSPEDTLLSFESDFGFDLAVEMCNGAAVCRQLDEGVMCPSFKATRDEKHSTRGRSNMLRAAISGKLGQQGLSSPDLYQVLDLCLSCQACASECPSRVDMSKLKAEFLHQYYQVRGVPFRSWFFANIEEISSLVQPFAGLVNPILNLPMIRIQRLLGIHPDRKLPPFAKQKFTDWYKGQSQIKEQEVNQGVVFYHDTYLEYNYPHIGKAVVNIFQKAGINLIVLPRKADSGRPAYSKGVLNKSRNLAQKNIQQLIPLAEQGWPILVCEPTVAVMLKNEYRDLVPGPESELISQSTMLIENYLLGEIRAGRVQFRYKDQPRQVLYHGHCQQKSHLGTDNTLQLLKTIPNCQVEEIDATCCGMAGAFGYESEHYQLSLEIAELGIAPPIRESSQKTIIAASGTSCREQITHTTSRYALHPLEVFSEALL